MVSPFVARASLRLIGSQSHLIFPRSFLSHNSFRLYIIWTEKDQGYEDVYKSLTVFSALAIALTLVTTAMSIICLRHFGKGLKEAMNRTAAETQRLAAGGGGSASAYITGYHQGGKQMDMLPLSR